jgi:hypothetical protein
MVPIRKGDGTGLLANGFAEVRKGDGTVLSSGAIPDSVVSRADDDDTFGMTNSEGLVISPNSSFSKIAARISTNTSGATRARLYDYDSSSYVVTIDISSLSAGDTFTFESDFDDGSEYGIELDANGSSWTYGWRNASPSTDYPVTGDDIDITGNSQDGVKKSGAYRAINDIGNPDNVLD